MHYVCNKKIGRKDTYVSVSILPAMYVLIWDSTTPTSHPASVGSEKWGLVRWPPGPSPAAWSGVGAWKALQHRGPQWNGNRNRKISQEPSESMWASEPLVLSPAGASEASRRHSQSRPNMVAQLSLKAHWISILVGKKLAKKQNKQHHWGL